MQVQCITFWTILTFQAITALSLQFNSLGFEGIMVLGPLIRTLQNLTGLDLSCNAVDLRRTEVCEQMRRTLSSLPCLSRLNMCGNWIKSHLQTLVSDIQKPLEYLRLGGCGLQKEDIAYLQRSHHATSLRSLDISECIMRSPDVVAVLLSLLRALAPSVQELVMEDMGLAQEEWEQVVSQCHQMVNLRFWNITHNVNIVSSVLTSSVSQFVKMPKLQVLHFDFPAECYIAVDPNEVEVEQLAFFNTYSRLLTLQCLESNRPFIKLVPRQWNFKKQLCNICGSYHWYEECAIHMM